MSRVRECLLDNVGHMTYPGNASYDRNSQHWFVPVYCRTDRGNVVIADVEVDASGQIVAAPSQEEMLARLKAVPAGT